MLEKYLVLARLMRCEVTRFAAPPLLLRIRDAVGLGTLQSSIVDFYADVVRPEVMSSRSPMIVDVGANIGQFVNAAKLFFPGARVLCFEPDPRTFADLQANTAGMTEVTLHNVGIGEGEGTLLFHRHRLSVMSSFRPLASAEGSLGDITLPVARLDDVVGPELSPDLVKIDVEGYEARVLAGGWEALRRSRLLLLELSLGRDDRAENLKLLHDIFEQVPGAAILRFGRPLGQPHRPQCQDVLFMIASDAQGRSSQGETP